MSSSSATLLLCWAEANKLIIIIIRLLLTLKCWGVYQLLMILLNTCWYWRRGRTGVIFRKSNGLLLLTARLKSNCATHWATMCLTLIWSLRTTLCWGLGFFWLWHLPWLVLPFRAVHQKTHRRGNISEWLSAVYDYLRLWSTFVEQHWDISITLSTANKNSTFKICAKR